MKGTTTKQQDLINFISEYQKQYKVAPTLTEIASKFGVSVAAISQTIGALERKRILFKNNLYVIKQ